jgi:hypothetical protein
MPYISNVNPESAHQLVLLQKLTIKEFNRTRSEKPEFYKIVPGDWIHLWPTLNAFRDEWTCPKVYQWDGHKLVLTGPLCTNT